MKKCEYRDCNSFSKYEDYNCEIKAGTDIKDCYVRRKNVIKNMSQIEMRMKYLSKTMIPDKMKTLIDNIKHAVIENVNNRKLLNWHLETFESKVAKWFSDNGEIVPTYSEITDNVREAAKDIDNVLFASNLTYEEMRDIIALIDKKLSKKYN